jgi:hypothetical protein
MAAAHLFPTGESQRNVDWGPMMILDTCCQFSCTKAYASHSLLASKPAYKVSSAACACSMKEKVDEKVGLGSNHGPFPDLDRTLETLRGSNGQSGGFCFNGAFIKIETAPLSQCKSKFNNVLNVSKRQLQRARIQRLPQANQALGTVTPIFRPPIHTGIIT